MKPRHALRMGICLKQNNDGASFFMPIFQYTNQTFMIFKEEISYGIYQSGSYGSADARYRPRCRSGSVGVVNLMEGYGNDNPGANAHVP